MAKQSASQIKEKRYKNSQESTTPQNASQKGLGSWEGDFQIGRYTIMEVVEVRDNGVHI